MVILFYSFKSLLSSISKFHYPISICCLFTNKGELVENVKMDDNLGDSDRKMHQFKILRKEWKKSSRINTLDFRKADVKVNGTGGQDHLEDKYERKRSPGKLVVH